MTFDQAEQFVHSRTRFGSQLGLSRMRRLLGLLGDPQDRLRFVHVAGTNGKGSTAKFIAAIAQESGLRTGLYVSPFVVEFRERYQINGEMIPPEEFVQLAEETIPLVERLEAAGEAVTEFELVTAIGFAWFARRGCELVVLEVGLGGRFDATNVISTPECAVICPISYDHTAILGDTLAQIAFEKAGIIKENTDVVTNPRQEPEALAVLLGRCAETGSRLRQPNAAAVERIECTPFGSRFRYAGAEYWLRLAGEHQVYNAAAALEATDVLRGKGFSLPPEAVRRALAETTFPARFEIVRERPLTILDGAHNPQAAAALAQTLEMLDRPRAAVIGMMRDKDCAGVARAIGGVCGAMVCVRVGFNPRSLSAEELAAFARPCCPRVETARDCRDALARARSLAGPEGAVVVCGSFYLASEMRRLEIRE